MNAICKVRSRVRLGLAVSDEHRIARLSPPPSERTGLISRSQQGPMAACPASAAVAAGVDNLRFEQKQDCHLDGLTRDRACQALA